MRNLFDVTALRSNWQHPQHVKSRAVSRLKNGLRENRCHLKGLPSWRSRIPEEGPGLKTLRRSLIHKWSSAIRLYSSLERSSTCIKTVSSLFGFIFFSFVCNHSFLASQSHGTSILWLRVTRAFLNIALHFLWPALHHLNSGIHRTYGQGISD